MIKKKLKIGIIGAMDEEIAEYIKHTQGCRQKKWHEFVFYQAKLFKQDVIIVKSGIGKVAAAMVCQKLIDEFKVSHIIFTGLAGALNVKYKIGDVVVSNDCLHHDLDARELGFSRGTVPFTDYKYFKAEENLKNLALLTKLPGNKVMAGRILTGDQFLTKSKIKKFKYLTKELKGDVVEMEGAAVAQVCVVNKIPFVVIRTISDKADGKAAQNFNEFLPQAAKNSFKVLGEIISHL